MAFDVCMIVLTAFAVLGGFFLLEMISDIIDGRDSPPSRTVMLYSEDDATYKKVRSIYNNIHNNRIIFINNDLNTGLYPDSTNCELCEISDIVTDVLFTKKL
ncbi:MAG: hypothetical protein IJD80_06875 [Oscillospiraceae bacterium]|nr:hypothetical protein [Oscillospiraceae bacterium]